MSAYTTYIFKDRNGREVKKVVVGPSGNPRSHEDEAEEIHWYLYNNPEAKVEIKGGL